MEIGVVGLGKMGGQIAEKLKNNGFNVFGFDHDKNISNNSKFSFEISNAIHLSVANLSLRSSLNLIVTLPSKEKSAFST